MFGLWIATVWNKGKVIQDVHSVKKNCTLRFQNKRYYIIYLKGINAFQDI